MGSESLNYWIGKNLDLTYLEVLYRENERGFRDKFQIEEPIFNADLIYKSIKSLYHDIKNMYFSDAEYNKFGPLYLYEINRSSESSL